MNTDIHTPSLNDAVDFVKISEGMGAKAIRVTKMEEVEPGDPRGSRNRRTCSTGLLDRSGSQRVPDGTGRRKS